MAEPSAPACACGRKMASASRMCGECARSRKQGQRYNWKDLTGKMFDRLTVVEPTSEYSHLGCVWLCRCSCGETVRWAAAKLTEMARQLASGKRQAPIACRPCVQRWMAAKRRAP